MSGLIEQLQDRATTPDEQLRVLDIDGEETDAILDALASETSRELYRTLFDQPATSSEIATQVDTSVQNVSYHLTKLEEAGLVEAIDTAYSEKGNEMTVYGPATDPLVLVGNHDIRPQIQQSLTDVVAGMGLLGLASLFVQWGAERIARTGSSGAIGVGPASPNSGSPDTPDILAWLVFEMIEPGVLFFFGCLFVVAALMYARNR